MRTTLDIDDDLLQAAKEVAHAKKTTAGRVLSDMARKGFSAPSEEMAEDMVLVNGFYMRRGRGGAIVTTELVNRILDEADLEDADLKGT